jgi:hypothetical protein
MKDALPVRKGSATVMLILQLRFMAYILASKYHLLLQARPGRLPF